MLKKGFSLIELLVVIAILGLVAAIAVPYYSRYTERASLAEVHRYADTLMSKWVEVTATNPDSLNDIQAGHFQPGIWYDSLQFPLITQARVYPGGAVIIFRDGSIEFAPGGSEARLWYVPTVDEETGIVTWECRFNSLGAIYGAMAPADVVTYYFPDCIVG